MCDKAPRSRVYTSEPPFQVQLSPTVMLHNAALPSWAQRGVFKKNHPLRDVFWKLRELA